jgi:hypothetical protein
VSPKYTDELDTKLAGLKLIKRFERMNEGFCQSINCSQTRTGLPGYTLNTTPTLGEMPPGPARHIPVETCRDNTELAYMVFLIAKQGHILNAILARYRVFSSLLCPVL